MAHDTPQPRLTGGLWTIRPCIPKAAFHRALPALLNATAAMTMQLINPDNRCTKIIVTGSRQ